VGDDEVMGSSTGTLDEKEKTKVNLYARSFKNRLIRTWLFIFFVIAVFLSLSGYFLYDSIRNLVVYELGNNAVNIAFTTAKFIEQDIDPFIALMQVEEYDRQEYDTDYYNRMQALFRELKKNTGSTFIFAEKKLSDLEIAYLIDGEDPQSGLFSPIGTVDNMGELELRVFKEGITGATDIVDWEFWGKFVTGYAPIMDRSTGEVVGVVGVDFSFEYIENLLNRIRRLIIFTFLLIALLGTYILNRLVIDRSMALCIDYLTGLHSKRYHDVRLNSLIRKRRLSGKPLSLMIMDVDSFKEINDEFGHDVGDETLKVVARKIKLYTRSTDICSRVGGDEFAIILPETDLERARLIGERIVERFRRDLSRTKKDGDPEITLSIGVAQWREGMNARELNQLADVAMYRAKGKGRNGVYAHEHR
jgi:diguanylate cyclase (GGDEF)-like protein